MKLLRFFVLLFTSLSCAHPSALAQGLGSGSYRAFVSTPEGSVNSDFQPVPTNVSFGYSGTDGFGNTYSYTGEAYATGGRIPVADIQAAGIGFLSSTTGATAEAKILYAYRVMPRAGSTRSAVPLLVTIAGDAQVSGSGQFPNAFSLAESIVRRPGTSSILVGAVASAEVNSIVMNPQDAFNVTQSTVVNVGSTGTVEIRAYGVILGDAEVSATADPIIVIDPDATYEEDGQTYFYADEFELEYSDTVVQWTPCPADLNGDGALDFFDVSAFLSAYNAGDYVADYTGDALFDFFDVSAFLGYFAKGCP